MNTKKWFVSKYVNSIRLQIVDPKKEGVFGTYCETWNDAKDVLLARAYNNQAQAKRDLVAAKRTIKKVLAMTAPVEPATP